MAEKYRVLAERTGLGKYVEGLRMAVFLPFVAVSMCIPSRSSVIFDDCGHCLSIREDVDALAELHLALGITLFIRSSI